MIFYHQFQTTQKNTDISVYDVVATVDTKIETGAKKPKAKKIKPIPLTSDLVYSASDIENLQETRKKDLATITRIKGIVADRDEELCILHVASSAHKTMEVEYKALLKQFNAFMRYINFTIYNFKEG